MKKVQLITGASRGIGRATALLAAKMGYRVVVNYHRNAEAANTVVSNIVEMGGEAIALQADISDEPQVQQMFTQVKASWGRVDVLVNNVGILEQQMSLKEMSLARWQRVFSSNVFGTFLCCREAIAHMSNSSGGNGGAIINVSSAASRIGAANEYIDYAASKGAMDSMTLGLANELANEGIRVNGVRPGFINTDIHASGGEPQRLQRVKSAIPLQRPGKPEEVAELIQFLASDKSSYMTGSIIDIAGGR